MSSFWSYWIIAFTALNIAGCYWLIKWAMKIPAGDSAEGDVTGHSWDGLEEFNNPLPRWWLWLFYITLIFSIAYLALYPGMGNFKGVFGWESGAVLNPGEGSQYAKEMNKADEKYGPIFQQYASVSVEDLATGEQYQEARDMGKRLYLTYCMQCHGSDALGSKGFPNLADDDWSWGGKPADIKSSIANGRRGMMPGFAHLGDDKIAQVTDYLVSLSGREGPGAKEGKQVYMTGGCAGCHGMDAKGQPFMGAPNLSDSTWIYGKSKSAIQKNIANGVKGEMPAHKDLLGDSKIHLLTAYVYSLSK